MHPCETAGLFVSGEAAPPDARGPVRLVARSRVPTCLGSTHWPPHLGVGGAIGDTPGL
jgi:hypothetical protein